jgi:hypothetical protein
MGDFFFSKDRIFKPGPIRAVYFLLFAVFFVLTELGREVYRPYVYQHGIDDLGFADVIGNLLGTVAIIFFNLGVAHANRIQSIRMVAFVTVGVMVYELSQAILPRGVLDWKDVISTPIAGLFSLMLVLVIWRVVPDPLSSNEEKANSS